MRIVLVKLPIAVLTFLICFLLFSFAPMVALAEGDAGIGNDTLADEDIDWPSMAMGVLGGLVIFLLGVERLANAFSRVGDQRIKQWIDRFTSNVWTSVLVGAIACTILDSSSATIIMVIAMIRGGLLTFDQSLGIVMGANIVRRLALRSLPWTSLVMRPSFCSWIHTDGAQEDYASGGHRDRTCWRGADFLWPWLS